MNWQPIETAPKDKPILMAIPNPEGPGYFMEVGWWEPDVPGLLAGHWASPTGLEPTHWMELPEPPEET